MAREHHQRLSPADVDEIWTRLRAGHSVRPTARALGLPTSTVRTYLIRCGGIRPGPRHRAAGRLSFEEREEIFRGLAADPLAVMTNVAGHHSLLRKTGDAMTEADKRRKDSGTRRPERDRRVRFDERHDALTRMTPQAFALRTHSYSLNRLYT